MNALPSLIYETEELITFKLDKEARERKIDNFIEWAFNVTRSTAIVDLFSINGDGIMDNKVYHGVYISQTDEFVPEGMKLSKALVKYYTPICGEEAIETIRCELSRLIQENSVTGKLCLSVHPLDFLSASENNHGWRSCHALDGEYRAGNLSYMMDKCTVIAYLKSDKEDVYLPRFGETKWNDKKWRCWFFFDFRRNIVWAGRQYPFSSDYALSAVVEKLFKPLNFFLTDDSAPIYPWELKWESAVIKDNPVINGREVPLIESYIAAMGSISPITNYIKSHSESMAFNDLLDSSFYTPVMLHFASQFPYMSNQDCPIIVGGRVPCLICGNSAVHHSEFMLCDQCLLDTDIESDEILECDICGARVWEEQSCTIDREGLTICPDCYQEHILVCSSCDEEFYVYDKDSLLNGEKPVLCPYCKETPNDNW